MTRAAQKLSVVLQALKERELAQLAVASRKQTELSNEVADLRLANIATQRRALNSKNISPSSFAGADSVWALWLASRITAKNTALAKHAAERELLVASSRKAFGRAAAFEALLTRRKNRETRS